MKKIIPSILVASLIFLMSSPSAVFAEDTVDIDITINQSLTLTLSEESLELGSDTGLNTDYMTVTGSTNNETGFKISFNVNNPYNDLKHENATIRENIPSITEDVTESTFPETAWAYTLNQENQTFHQLPLTSTNIFETTTNGSSANSFGIGAKVAADQTAGRYENELIFTIVANPIPPKTISRIKTMQQITPEICATSAEHETAQLKDTRDNKTYWVTKLKDGNCWMTQNLDYDLSVAANQTLTPATSNVTENRTVTPVSWGTDYNSIYYMDGGDNYLANGITQTAGLATLPADSIDRHYAQGDYYSWKAATAGVDADVNESICPSGWRLPISNSADVNYSFGNLVKQYGYTGSNQSSRVTDATLLASPLFFARGGVVLSGSLGDQGSFGLYWSSRANSSNNMAYSLLFDSSSVYPSYNDGRYYGFSVRCVAQAKDLSSISTMQEMTPEIVSKTPVDTSKQLTDTRDGKKYWVTKLKDGNIWMTQNLDYDLSVAANQTLTPATSNVTENRTVTPVAWGTDQNSVYYMDGGDTYYANGITKTEGYSSLPEDSTNRHYAQGDYYSWKAATAGQETVNADVNESICPAGWRLPTSNSANANYSFGNLVKQYGYTGANESASDATLLASPLFFARGGGVYSGLLDYQGSGGVYWSSRVDSNSDAYSLSFTSSGVYPSSYGGNRSYGFSVRCVAQDKDKDLNSISTMQEMTPEIVSKTPVDTSKQLTDTRDGKKYWVTKLADGNIWMTQNLDLDLSTTTTLTPADSDVTANWTPSRATITGVANLNSTNWVNNNNNPYSFDPGNYYFDGTYYSSANCHYLTTTCDHFATTPYDLNGEHGHVGNYYNWSAAVASNDTSATTAAGTDINTSICPKGWRLPHGYESAQGNDFETLNTAYGGVTNSDSVLLANPLFFVRGGIVYSGSLSYSAYNGYYWSSTAYSATYAGNLYFYSGSVSPSDFGTRVYGFSVRCLAR